MPDITQSTSPKTDKAQLLGHFYQYLGGRIDSVSRRSSLMMAFLASFLAFATSPLLKDNMITASGKLQYALSHPSIVLSLADVFLLL